MDFGLPNDEQKEAIERLEEKMYDLLEAEKVEWGVGLAAISLVMCCMVANMGLNAPDKLEQLFNNLRDSTIKAAKRMKESKKAN